MCEKTACKGPFFDRSKGFPFFLSFLLSGMLLNL